MLRVVSCSHFCIISHGESCWGQSASGGTRESSLINAQIDWHKEDCIYGCRMFTDVTWKYQLPNTWMSWALRSAAVERNLNSSGKLRLHTQFPPLGKLRVSEVSDPPGSYSSITVNSVHCTWNVWCEPRVGIKPLQSLSHLILVATLWNRNYFNSPFPVMDAEI